MVNQCIFSEPHANFHTILQKDHEVKVVTLAVHACFLRSSQPSVRVPAGVVVSFPSSGIAPCSLLRVEPPVMGESFTTLPDVGSRLPDPRADVLRWGPVKYTADSKFVKHNPACGLRQHTPGVDQDMVVLVIAASRNPHTKNSRRYS